MIPGPSILHKNSFMCPNNGKELGQRCGLKHDLLSRHNSAEVKASGGIILPSKPDATSLIQSL